MLFWFTFVDCRAKRDLVVSFSVGCVLFIFLSNSFSSLCAFFCVCYGRSLFLVLSPAPQCAVTFKLAEFCESSRTTNKHRATGSALLLLYIVFIRSTVHPIALSVSIRLIHIIFCFEQLQPECGVLSSCV